MKMTKEEWKQIEKEIKEEGCTAREYCEKHGINLNTYYVAISQARKKEIKIIKVKPTEKEQELTIHFQSCECTMKVEDEASLIRIMKVLKDV